MFERLEVVPLVFDFGPAGHGEAEPAHDVLELFDRLRERMQMAEPQAACRAAWGRTARRVVVGRLAERDALAGGGEGGLDGAS